MLVAIREEMVLEAMRENAKGHEHWEGRSLETQQDAGGRGDRGNVGEARGIESSPWPGGYVWEASVWRKEIQLCQTLLDRPRVLTKELSLKLSYTDVTGDFAKKQLCDRGGQADYTEWWRTGQRKAAECREFLLCFKGTMIGHQESLFCFVK